MMAGPGAKGTLDSVSTNWAGELEKEDITLDVYNNEEPYIYIFVYLYIASLNLEEHLWYYIITDVLIITAMQCIINIAELSVCLLTN